MGYGARLAGAFEQMGRLPALHESCRRFEALLEDGSSGPHEIADAVVSDLGLATAILRSANHPRRGHPRRILTLSAAIDVLPRSVLLAIGERIATQDFFDRDPVWGLAVEQYRIHAVSTQVFAGRVAAMAGERDTDMVLVAALFHDLGKLVLHQASPSYPFPGGVNARSPEERVAAERRALGIDHSTVGAVLVRKWNLPGQLAHTIARHHEGDSAGPAGIVRLADMLAHYHAGARVGGAALADAASNVGVSSSALRELLSAPPTVRGSLQQHGSCPLSTRELGVLRGLAAGGVYEDVARSMGVSASTVRSHLSSAAKKIGVRDRAHAVLLASERGWI